MSDNFIIIVTSLMSVFAPDSIDCKKIVLPDSVVSFERSHSMFVDKNVQYIENVTNENRPFSAPSLTLFLSENQKVFIVILDDEKKVYRILISKYLSKGKYRIYFKNGLMEEYGMGRLFYILILQNDSCVLRKALTIK